jgi:uncharacterized protein YcsI (UPF0317 family)
MYRTDIACTPAGPFEGPMVVSMRPFRPADAIRAIQITTRFPAVHGAPVHIGLPRSIGIEHLGRPDFGEAVPIGEDELPVFWACGVTPQAVIQAVKPPFAITHAPGRIFATAGSLRSRASLEARAMAARRGRALAQRRSVAETLNRTQSRRGEGP